MNRYCIMPEQADCSHCNYWCIDYDKENSYGCIRKNHVKYYEDLWFKLCCFYHAKTELYDRSLSDFRSPYDHTSAFVYGQHRISLSRAYASKMYKYIHDIARELYIPEYIINEGVSCNRYSFSAQHWVDLYNHYLENGEMDFLKEET